MPRPLKKIKTKKDGPPASNELTAVGNNHLPSWAYDASGNATSDGVVTNYVWNAESELKSAAGVTYTYDGDGRRVSKVGSKLYWYGSGDDILAETDASGNATAEYIFFGGKRIAMIPDGANPTYYVEDLLGTSRVLTTNTGVVCYDADFYPYGGERSYTNTCLQNYKFEGKERDTETGNDDFGARYYSNRFGRWLSADWSSVPVAVPYANLMNPQTLNLYAMVADDPESFADLDGHTEATSANDTCGGQECSGANSDPGSFNNPPGAAPAANQSQAAKKPALTITYDKNVPKMSPQVEKYVKDVLTASGVTSANISATTNGQHAPNSWHYDAQAVDINRIDGRPVREASSDLKLAATIESVQHNANNKSTGVAHENYGPAGLFREGRQLNGKQGANVPLQSQHDNHIHLTIPNPRRIQ